MQIPVIQVEFYSSSADGNTPSLGMAYMQAIPRVGESVYLQLNWGKPAATQKGYVVRSILWAVKDVNTLDSTIHDKVSDAVRVYIEELK